MKFCISCMHLRFTRVPLVLPFTFSREFLYVSNSAGMLTSNFSVKWAHFFLHTVGFGCGSLWLSGPPVHHHHHLLMFYIHPLDGFMCVQVVPLLGNQSKAVHFYSNTSQASCSIILPLCGMYVLLELWHNWHLNYKVKLVIASCCCMWLYFLF